MRLGVLGWPVAHSRSPAMHNAALAALGMDGWHYQALPVPPELFEETVRALATAGFAGANVTIPHKEAALALADVASDAARAIGAANTLTFDGAVIRAENTDAPGFMDALGTAPESALVLGAGGSARAVAWALREAGTRVAIWNRTPERAAALAAQLGVEHVRDATPAQLLVSATPVGLDAGADPFKALPVTADALSTYATVADLAYGAGDTPLLAAARRAGCTVVDGLEVLVAQGARSLRTWTGRVAPLDAMREGARRNDT